MPQAADPNRARRRAINTKISDDLRSRIEASAARNGRTVSHEIEARLDGSFAEENVTTALFGDEGLASIAMTFAGIVRRVQQQTGKQFGEDAGTFAASTIGMSAVIRMYADLCGTVSDEEYPSLYSVGKTAAEAAIRSTNVTLRQEFLDLDQIDDTLVDVSLFDPTKTSSALRKRSPRIKKPA